MADEEVDGTGVSPSGAHLLRGQYAVLMKKGDHNVLCMVEKEPGWPAFAITVETDKAVH